MPDSLLENLSHQQSCGPAWKGEKPQEGGGGAAQRKARRTKEVWNSTLTRKTPLRAKKPWRPERKPIQKKTAMTAKKPMKRAGKKTKEWDACRARLKPRFVRAGITTCELRFTGCWHTVGGFAHSLKRRNITTPELLEEVVAACNVCHDTLEGWPEEMMAEHVRKVIADRPVAV